MDAAILALLPAGVPMSDVITMPCPGCSQTLRFPAEVAAAGKKVKCPGCNTVLTPTVPAAVAAPVGTSPVWSAPAVPQVVPMPQPAPLPGPLPNPAPALQPFGAGSSFPMQQPMPNAGLPSAGWQAPPVNPPKGSWLPILLILGGLVGAPLLLLGLAAVLFFGARSFTDSPSRILSELKTCNEKHAAIMKQVTGESSRPAAIAELKKLQETSDLLLLRAGKFKNLSTQETEKLKGARISAEKSTFERYEQEQKLRATPFLMDGELGQLSGEIGNNTHAISQYFWYGAVKLSTPTDTTSTHFGSFLEYKRNAIEAMSHCKSPADVAKTELNLQVLADALNLQVEGNSGAGGGGGRIMIRIPNDYKSADGALKQMFSAMRSTIERRANRSPSLGHTIGDVEMVLDRAESVAFGDRIERLGTTSNQRVAQKLGQNNVAGGPAAGIGFPMGAVPPPSPVPGSPDQIPGFNAPPFRGPRMPPNNTNAGAIPVPGGSAAPPPGYGQPPGTPPGFPPGFPGFPSNPPASPPAASPPGNIPPSSVPPGYGGMPMMDPATSVTIRVTGAKGMNETAVRDSLAKALGSSQTSNSRSGDSVTIQLQYTGPLARVIPLITFGNVTSTDEKTRTLYVTAK